MKKAPFIFIVLMLSAASAAANPAVSLHVRWIDWPNKDTSEQEIDNFEDYRDSKLEVNLTTALVKTLRAANINTSPTADLIVQIRVTGTTIVRRFNDSLYGTVNNRPTEYAGKYTVAVRRGGETVSRHGSKFSFKSSYGSGRTSTRMSKIKVTGLVNDGLADHIKKKSFRKALSARPLSLETTNQ